ncbi:Ubiquinone/menaquinone biosynthesis C-methylase UbiE [Haloechinothrix alba]|uniref:Ubiquinone/menaquinone biosynthesis C-methylase UbiE n=1 Tax=Haloechinothrix alba TaxID=664784 RepID=A0A238XKY8_9PSEU|nr:methyltransferase domain-containing protein [Haloechinothrix alba]SNR59686.1 Ubiquinone/menaquinone biosynthesis C-methylase UbiE [Haloechinothrix alba]
MTTGLRTTEQRRVAWEKIAPAYDEYVAPLATTLAQAIIGEFGIRPGLRCLDAGAGVGALAVPAARLGARVVAVDFAPTMISRLTARAATAGLSDLDGQVMDGQAIEVDDGSFDVAASLDGIAWFHDPRAGLAELVRVTKPGGRVVVAASGAPWRTEWGRFFRSALHVAVPGAARPADLPAYAEPFDDPHQLRRALTTAGLAGVQVMTTDVSTRFRSAQHLWDVVMSGDPTGTGRSIGLTDRRIADTRQVLDGMLRERSGGRPGAVLHTGLAVATGIKRSRGRPVPAHTKERRS